MQWSNKTILVTGAGGFIGSHLTETLVDRGSHVKAFVHYNSRNNWGLLELLPDEKLHNIELIMGDLKDGDAILQAIDDIDIVYHLGSIISIPYSYQHPRDTIETNILGTLNLLSAARKNDIEKFIHTSTSEVYGTAKYVPIDEKHSLQGQSPYSASKIGADSIAESFYRTYDIPLAIIRPFNTYGPRQSARAVIPAIITQVIAKDRIFLGSLDTTRDFTFIRDTISGFIKIAESNASIGEIINIGSNCEISIRELVNKILGILEKDVEIITESRRIRPANSEVRRLWCDNTKAKKMLNWSPTVKMEDGLRQTISWLSEQRDLYKPQIYSI